MLTWNGALILLCVIANWNDHRRLWAIWAVYALQFCHTLIFDGASDAFTYWSSAGLFDALTVIAMLYAPRSLLAFDLAVINFVSFFVNVAGYTLFMFGVKTVYYNNAIKALLIIQAARMLWGGGQHWRHVSKWLKKRYAPDYLHVAWGRLWKS